jgi:hypothetical protein
MIVITANRPLTAQVIADVEHGVARGGVLALPPDVRVEHVDDVTPRWGDTNHHCGPARISHGQAASVAARCEYCGLYGPLGRCSGCGAPNRPRNDTAPNRRVVAPPCVRRLR